MKPVPFEYHRPASLAETFDLLDRYGDDGRILAGGQSLVPALALRLAAFRDLAAGRGRASDVLPAGHAFWMGEASSFVALCAPPAFPRASASSSCTARTSGSCPKRCGGSGAIGRCPATPWARPISTAAG